MRIIASLLAVGVAYLAPAKLAPAAPTTLPTIPALNSDEGRTFVVDGVCRMTAEDGLGFHFATDGTQELCAIFDLHDGTPLYLSDGHQTLVYDLTNNRVVRVPASRAYVVIDWNPKEQRPLVFSAGVKFDTDPKKLAEAKSSFRVDRFVGASAGSLRQLEGGEDTHLFAAQRADGHIDTVQVRPGNSDWFRFTSCQGGEDFYGLELEATLPRALPAAALRFADLAALRRDIEIADLDEQLMPNLVLFLKSGHASLAKMALAGGEAMRTEADKVLLSPNWNELRERDRRLGKAYRAALAKQGVTFRGMANAPSTQRSR